MSCTCVKGETCGATPPRRSVSASCSACRSSTSVPPPNTLARNTCTHTHIQCNIYMWPILMQFLRTNAPYITLPIAAVVGIIGYNLESLLSDRYTPYNKPVQDQRFERMTEEDSLKDPTNVKKLKYQENVLGKNIPPSLEKH
ncbi:hypothetical protein RR48_06504 [Papilio machaon]|uniref:Small integral membrane protein 12 n=3 Tax=Papilio TaxID=7145 RepID=A0A194RQG7_PAPMA|nr:hypothetical protein RR48_06504 [Papilio machaon]